jgi:hypothetical protein
MSARPWNTVAKRNILLDLMELLLQAMDRENVAKADNLDDLFGDLAYPMLAYLYGGVTQPAPGSIEAAWNTKMASAQIVVEWTLGEVGRQFCQLDLKQPLMTYKMPVAKYYAVAVFLVNCQNSCYGGETTSYFSCEPMTLEEYIGLVHWN